MSGLIDTLPVVIFKADNTGRIEFLNRRGQSLFGRSAEDIESGISIFNLCTPESLAGLKEDFDRLIKYNAVINSQYSMTIANGDSLPMLLQAELESETVGEIRVAGVLTDISRFANGVADDNHAPKESEAKYRTFFENAPVGISILSIDGGAAERNKAAMKMHGYDSMEEFPALRGRGFIRQPG